MSEHCPGYEIGEPCEFEGVVEHPGETCTYCQKFAIAIANERARRASIRYEYTMRSCRVTLVMEKLAEMGLDRWELVAVRATANEDRLYFKREIV